MAIIGDALRQAFMPKHDYESLRNEDKALARLYRPLLISFMAIIWLLISVSTVVSLKIVFPGSGGKRPFCGESRIQQIPLVGMKSDSDPVLGSFYLTDQETVDYYWMVVFIPSAIVFLVSVVYLAAGIVVAYSPPTGHRCLCVVENNYCASKRGGVRCLSILNMIFAIIYGLLAVFLGSSLLTLGSSCSAPLFWCYEISVWGLVLLYGGTSLSLRRKGSVVLEEGEVLGQNHGVEMLEAGGPDDLFHVTPDVERRVCEGFEAWAGSGLLSSDEEENGSDGYREALGPARLR